MSCLLPTGCNAICQEERDRVCFFTLPSRVIPVKKACDSSCRMTQALMVFLEPSHNQFNVSDPKTNVSFCLQHHQQFSKLWLLFHMPCKRFRELSTGWKQRAPDILIYFHSLDGYDSGHSLFLSISIYKQERLEDLGNACKVLF